MTDFWTYFSHGSEYTGDNQAVDEPRRKSCSSCAFTDCKDTVRPKDISLIEMLEKGDEFDVFYCHEPDTDGRLKICAAWYKHFGDICLPSLTVSEQEINTILNKDL